MKALGNGTRVKMLLGRWTITAARRTIATVRMRGNPVSEVCVGQVERKRRDKNFWSEMQAFALYVRIAFVQPNT